MLKKLKLKFILNNMLLVSVVLFTVFSSLCLLNYVREENRITNALDENLILAKDGNLPILPILPNDNDNISYDISFTVLVDGDGNTVAQSGSELSDKTLERAVSRAWSYEYERGNIMPLGLSFKKAETENGTVIAFVSRENLDSRMKEVIFQALSAGVVSLLLFLYISNRLADISIAPVEEAWKQQKQFLADASHDLKTPITVILANNNIIAAHKDSTVESQMKWIESTSDEAGRMRDLVNNMLELAKNESMNEELKFGEVNISDAVENATLQFEVVAFEKNVTIESSVQPNIIVKTHRTTFSKVLEILFDNAIKYSDAGSNINVSLYQASKKVYFTINNSGEPISREDLPHIFERFYRTNKERDVGGHGLGLSLAKKKCELLGIKISVESNAEDGTTFALQMKAKK